MKILMLGNSFTYYNDLPQMLAKLLSAEVSSNTRGGAYLYEHFTEGEELCKLTQTALQNEKWDYVVLQEQSFAPIQKREQFQLSVSKLCEQIRQNGAKPILYSTWAYREGSEKLASTGISYEEMDEGLCDSYHEACRTNGTLIADVGKAFTAMRELLPLYTEDNYHPSFCGSLLAAQAIARVIEKDWNK